MQSILQCHHIFKSYEDKMVLQDFSYEFYANQVYLIYGKSGIGKTTLLDVIVNLKPVDQGSITLQSGMKIAYLFQSQILFEEFTTLQNVLFNSKNKAKAIEILQAFGLEKELNQKVKELSGGMRQRVCLGRLLMQEADIYLFDEPLQGLDETTKSIVMSYLTKVLQSKTILWISHDEKDQQYFTNPNLITL